MVVSTLLYFKSLPRQTQQTPPHSQLGPSYRALGGTVTLEQKAARPIHIAVYALIGDFQAIPDAGPIFVGGDEELYRVGFAPGFSRI